MLLIMYVSVASPCVLLMFMFYAWYSVGMRLESLPHSPVLYHLVQVCNVQPPCYGGGAALIYKKISNILWLGKLWTLAILYVIHVDIARHSVQSEPEGCSPEGEGYTSCASHNCPALEISQRWGACALLGSSRWCVWLTCVLVLQDKEFDWCITCP